MLTENKNITTTTYDYKDGFNIDVTINNQEGTYDVFLYHESYSTKEHMFGGAIKDVTTAGLLEMIENILLVENDIPRYIDKYMGN